MKAVPNTPKTLSLSKKEADAILATRANRLLLVEALLICMVFAALFTSLSAALALLLPLAEQLIPAGGFLLDALLSALLNLLVVFLIAPVLLGLFRIAFLTYTGDDAALSDLFYYLSNGERFYRGWTLAWGVVWRLALGTFVMNATTLLFQNTLAQMPFSTLLHTALIALECIATLALLFLRHSFCFYALRNEDAPLWQAREAARRFRRAHPHSGVRFFFGFLGWILLGVLSIGLLLLIDVVPRMLLTYFCDCDRQTEDPPV